jgi:hypothetical protein
MIGWEAGLPAQEGPEVMWNFFRATTLLVAVERLVALRMARKGFVFEGMLRLIDRSQKARLNSDQEVRKLRSLTVRSLSADKKAHELDQVCQQRVADR